MAEHSIRVGKIQILFFKGNRRVQFALGTLLVLTAAALAMLTFVRIQMTRETADMRTQAGVIEYENEVLEDRIQSLGSSESTERIAEEELQLVPDNMILIDAKVK